jgi:hypothetical protein
MAITVQFSESRCQDAVAHGQPLQVYRHRSGPTAPSPTGWTSKIVANQTAPWATSDPSPASLELNNLLGSCG